MSSFSITRKVTSEDWERVLKAAERFCKKRNLRPSLVWVDGEDRLDYYGEVQIFVDQNNHFYGDRNSVRAWRRMFARALIEKESKDLTIVNGYVAHRCS